MTGGLGVRFSKYRHRTVTTSNSPSRSPRPFSRLAAAILLVWVAAIALQQWRVEARQQAPSIADASWIWASGPWKWHAAPAAFLAACDFDLRAPAPEARLLVLADEAALVWVNGRLVASSEYHPGDRMGVVPLGDRVRVGGNRVVAQLRSGRGAGGLLAAIEPGGGQGVACASGGSWRIFRTAPPGLIAGWAPLVAGEPPVLLGRPPVARWGETAPGATLPRWDRVETAQPLAPLGSRRGRAAEVRARAAANAGAAATVPPVDLIFDWGREVEGILEVVLAKDDVSKSATGSSADRPAVIRFSSEPPPADGPEVVLVVPSGDRRWRDAVPRSFRYARVVGFLAIDRVAVLPLPATLVPPPAPPPAGVLGIEPPPQQSAAVGEIRRLLRAASAASE